MLGSMLKGVALCATLALAAVGALTFVPDESWERFPSALAPTRAQLAEFGIAPTKYRASAPGGEITLVDDASSSSSATPSATSNESNSSETRSRVRVGIGRGSFSSGVSSNFDASSLDSPTSLASSQFEDRSRPSETTTTAPEVPGDSAEIRAPLFEGETSVSNAPFDPTREIPEPAPVEDPSSFSPELFAENAPASAPSSAPSSPTDDRLTPVVAPNDLSALQPTPFSAQANELPNSHVATPLAPLAEQQTPPVEAPQTSALAQSAPATPISDATTLSTDASVLQAPQSRPDLARSEPLATPAQDEVIKIPDTSSTTDVLNVSADLERALNAVGSLNTNEQARDVLTTLNRIQRAQNGALAEGDRARLNEALDQLAYEAFYNPSRFLLEAPRKTAPGETLSSIAREYDVTPRLIASINSLNFGLDDPLPPGTSLKTVRGPVTAEVSVSRKELLLRFNDIYAGRFKLGVPRQATTLRGTHLVESKIANPACDAVDASGATISIPGGTPDNPLGACWIGLSGGYGLQGTNRPELIGTIVQENGGFVFSNLEISQLDVLLPIGAAISFVD